MDTREEIREKAVRSTCKRCQGATEVIFPRKGVDIALMILMFLILGFGFSTCNMLGNDTNSQATAATFTAIASLFIGGFVGSIVFKLFCCYAGIRLCHCWHWPWSKE